MIFNNQESQCLTKKKRVKKKKKQPPKPITENRKGRPERSKDSLLLSRLILKKELEYVHTFLSLDNIIELCISIMSFISQKMC